MSDVRSIFYSIGLDLGMGLLSPSASSVQKENKTKLLLLLYNEKSRKRLTSEYPRFSSKYNPLCLFENMSSIVDYEI